ncbi:S-layer homology domain-containing protein [Cohnella sp. GCM10027633]|uniref:S-layer homology domain-containing protein n=1 Tax=unclassified Cohnella TaxID=2636738 RepID=UPI00362602A4
MNKQAIALMLAAAIATTGALVPYNVTQAQTARISFSDLAQAGSYQAALQALADKRILAGYADGTVKPNRTMNRAELSKVLAVAFGLNPQGAAELTADDVSKDHWYYRYAAALSGNGILQAENGKYLPHANVTQEQLVGAVAKLINKKPIIVQTWVDGYEADATATRGVAAQLVWEAIPHIPSASATVTGVKALNPATLEVTFSAPLTAADVNLEQAKLNFAFDNGIGILNVPQLKNGARSTYIVPVTVQQPGTTYKLTYKGTVAGSFEAATNKVTLGTARQVSNDTFEVESYRAEGTADYAYLVEAYYGSRNGQEIALDENNAHNGQSYMIVSSLRDKSVTLTPEGGEPIVAAYVPYTQATDGRQAPKFRLPSGTTLQPGVQYTVTSSWATVKDASFVAGAIAPLTVASTVAVSETSIEVALSQDPKDELFSGRGVELTAADGTKLTAQYRVQTRKGAVGTFDLAAGGKLAPGTTYAVAPIGNWAIASGVTVTTK